MKQPVPVFTVFTVFTATYNRRGPLGDAYACLCAQTFKDFEWLIVDDGSTDGTRDLVSTWRDEGLLNIRYIYKKNGGPHTAHNVALKYAGGELFLRLDSDDVMRVDAMERLYHYWSQIDCSVRGGYSGVSCLCGNEVGEVIGDRYRADIWDGHCIENLDLKGEKWGFHLTEVLRRYPFPEFFGEKFVPEGLIWNRIGRHYKTRCVNDVLRTYRRSASSITARMDRTRYQCPNGTLLYYLELLNLNLNLRVKLRAAVNYVRFSLGAGRPLITAIRQTPRKGVAVVVAPLAICIYLRDRYWRHSV